MEHRIFKYEIEEDFAALLPEALGKIPGWRLSKALSYRKDLDRYLCAEAYLLLKDGLKELYGIDEELEFEYEASGKPLLKGHKDIHFNISHCPKCVCCVISDRQAGIDVEEIQYDRTVAEMVFNEEELEMISISGKPEIEFTKIWTMKEAYLKMTGEGIRNDMKNVLEVPQDRFYIETNEQKGYVLTCLIK